GHLLVHADLAVGAGVVPIGLRTPQRVAVYAAGALVDDRPQGRCAVAVRRRIGQPVVPVSRSPLGPAGPMYERAVVDLRQVVPDGLRVRPPQPTPRRRGDRYLPVLGLDG